MTTFALVLLTAAALLITAAAALVDPRAGLAVAGVCAGLAGWNLLPDAGNRR